MQARKNLQTSHNGENSIAAADLLELTATFNLFNGFADKSTIAQTADKLSTSEDLRDKACVDTRQTLAIAYNDISSLKEQLNYRDQHQLSIEKAREAYLSNLILVNVHCWIYWIQRTNTFKPDVPTPMPSLIYMPPMHGLMPAKVTCSAS